MLQVTSDESELFTGNPFLKIDPNTGAFVSIQLGRAKAIVTS